MRLDQALVVKNFYPTRAKAVAAIKAGLVYVNKQIAQKPSQNIKDTDELIAGNLPYSASRGSLKLSHALDCFNINPDGMVCLDVGASTGGFTETLLNRGAKRVIAVDVGTNQLAPNLRSDARVMSLEKTDIRALCPIEQVDLIVIDVSFISLTNIADALQKWGAKKIIALIKPQFEVPREVAARYNGVIRSEIDRNQAIDKVRSYFEKLGLKCIGVIQSPILGGSGNVEFLACFINLK